MKKLSIIAALPLVGLLVGSCGLQEPAAVSEQPGEKTISVGLSPVQSKTWLDYANKEAGQPIKVYWSDGDKINVNGLSSLPLKVDEGEKKVTADFQLPSIQAPYYIVYPGEIVDGQEYDADGTISVQLPSVQAYSPNSFGSGAALMCGFSQTLEDAKLQNLCAAIRVNIKGKDIIVDAKLASASAEAPLCGSFRLAPQTGALTAVEGKNEVALCLEEVELNSETGTDFFFTVPAGDYSEGLTFYFTRKKDRLQMQNVWHPKSALEAGKLYSFNDVEYVPMAKDIETVEEWEEFAAAMNSSDDISKYMHKGGIVRLGADLEADNLTSITATFPYVFEGNGKTITRNAATSSLFAKLTGEIRNLTLDGELNLSNAEDAPFVKHISAGAKITGCTNNMDVTFDIKADGDVHCYVTGIAAVAVRNDTEGLEFLEISNCTNNGKIEGTVDVSSASLNTAVAGIIGDVRASVGNFDYSLVLTNCKNTAPITLSPKSGDTATYGMTACGVGGIIGYVRSAVSIALTNCDNSGDITVKADYIASETGLKATPTAVGGIIGIGTGVSSSKLPLTGIDYTLTGCDNSGKIYNCMVNASADKESCNKVYTGGLAGALVGKSDKYAKITSCTNIGDIYTYDLFGPSSASTPGTSAVGAGFIGFGGHLDMSGCSVNCTLGNGKRPVVSWGGVIGFAMRPFTLRDSDVYVTGYFQRLITYKLNRAMVAVMPTYYLTAEEVSTKMDTAPSLTGTVVENCRIGGHLRTSGTTLATDDKSEITGLATNLFTSETSAENNIVAGTGYSTNKNCGLTFDKDKISYWDGN